jgi:hypothetical protein
VRFAVHLIKVFVSVLMPLIELVMIVLVRGLIAIVGMGQRRGRNNGRKERSGND